MGLEKKRFSIYRLRNMLFLGCQGQDKFAYGEALTDRRFHEIPGESPHPRLFSHEWEKGEGFLN
jgi:hypothetical protein